MKNSRKKSKKKIRSGEINIGQLIVPKKYEKLVLNVDSEIEKIEFFVEGRKIPLDDVRERLLLKHKKLTRFHLDEYYGSMSRIAVSNRLADVGELDETEALSTMRQN